MKKSNEMFLKSVKNKNGEWFDLAWNKWIETTDADYRMYFIKASHKQWGARIFTIIVTKVKYPEETDATGLVTNYCVQEVEKRLNLADKDGIPLILNPLTNEGWVMI